MGGVIIFVLCTSTLYLPYICTKFHENILDDILSYRADTFYIGKSSKGQTSAKNVVGSVVFFLHIVRWWFIFEPSFTKISLTVLKL